MAKIQFVTQRQYLKNGESKPIWDCMLTMSTGEDRGAVSFDEVKKGDEIEDSRVESDNRGGWRIKSVSKSGGKQWPRNDELQIAQTVFKALVDLHVQGRILMFDTDSDRYFDQSELGVQMGKTIQAIARKLKAPCQQAAVAGPAVQQPQDDFDKEFPRIESVGNLCTWAYDTYGKTMSLAKICNILKVKDIKEVKDFDAACRQIRANQEAKC